MHYTFDTSTVQSIYKVISKKNNSHRFLIKFIIILLHRSIEVATFLLIQRNYKQDIYKLHCLVYKIELSTRDA